MESLHFYPQSGYGTMKIIRYYAILIIVMNLNMTQAA